MRLLLTSLMGFGMAVVSLTAQTASPDAAPAKAERFDTMVREDIFAGFNGNRKRLEIGMKRVDETLAKNPKHAEALVWRGAARVFLAGQAFQNKQNDEGMSLWTNGSKDMDDAVALEPKNIGVRVPRAVALTPAARNVPEFLRKPILAKILDDFQTIYDLQKKDFAKLGTHPRGELRMGLADAYRMSGELAKSREQLNAILTELPDTKYAARAQEWLDAKNDAKLVHNCIGCHSTK